MSKKFKTDGYDATCLDCGGEIEEIRHKSLTGGADGGVPRNGWCECYGESTDQKEFVIASVSNIQWRYWSEKGTLDDDPKYPHVNLQGDVSIVIERWRFEEYIDRSSIEYPQNIYEIAMHENYQEIWGEFDI
jgi:hypothetical protein